MARKSAQVKDFADFREQQLNTGKFKFIRANASFVNEHTVELTSPHPDPLPVGRREGEEMDTARIDPLAPPKRGEGGRRPGEGKLITAKYFVIATGSSVASAPLPQLDAVGFITSDDAVALKKLPKSLIILGGGAIACEFAQFFARFGVKVTLLQRSEHILKEFDADTGIEIETVFRREGIQIFTGVKLTGAKTNGEIEDRFL